MRTARLTISQEVGELAVVREFLRDWFARAALPPGLQGNLILAVHEAAANSVQHGAAPIEIWGAITDTRVTVEIVDCGEWKNQPLDNPERGRGLLLMRGLVEDVEISKKSDGTTVRLRQTLWSV